jgi:hypothetical protein
MIDIHHEKSDFVFEGIVVADPVSGHGIGGKFGPAFCAGCLEVYGDSLVSGEDITPARWGVVNNSGGIYVDFFVMIT